MREDFIESIWGGFCPGDVLRCYFWANRENHYVMTLRTHSGTEDSVLPLTKTLHAPSVASGASSMVSRLNGSHGPSRQLARYRVPSIVLTTALPFLKRWGPLPELRRLLFTS